MSFSDKIQSLNDALFPTNPSKETADRLGVFGGQSFGFAHGVDTLFAQTFYKDRAVPDEFGVAVGMNAPVPKSIFNKFALSLSAFKLTKFPELSEIPKLLISAIFCLMVPAALVSTT